VSELCGVPWCEEPAHPDCYGVCEGHRREEQALAALDEEYQNCWTDDDLERTKPIVVRAVAFEWEAHGASPYGRAVLAAAAQDVANAQPGNRNNTLRRRSRIVGGFVGSGYIEAGHAAVVLLEAALLAEMGEREACDVIERGLRDGARKPIEPPERLAS
jgi:hypothetical protein